MNWTGGRLQQSRRAKGGISAQQKTYFAKARAKLLNDDHPRPPLNISPFGNIQTNLKAITAENQECSQFASGEREAGLALEELQHNVQNTLPRNQLRVLSPRDIEVSKHTSTKRTAPYRSVNLRGNEVSITHIDKKRKTKDQGGSTHGKHNSNPIADGSAFVERKRQELLQRDDWVRSVPMRPLPLDFSYKQDQKKVGRRRKLNEDDLVRLDQQRRTGHERGFVNSSSPARSLRPQQSAISVRHGTQIHRSQSTQLAAPMPELKSPSRSWTQPEEMLLDSSPSSMCIQSSGARGSQLSNFHYSLRARSRCNTPIVKQKRLHSDPYQGSTEAPDPPSLRLQKPVDQTRECQSSENASTFKTSPPQTIAQQADREQWRQDFHFQLTSKEQSIRGVERSPLPASLSDRDTGDPPEAASEIAFRGRGRSSTEVIGQSRLENSARAPKESQRSGSPGRLHTNRVSAGSETESSPDAIIGTVNGEDAPERRVNVGFKEAREDGKRKRNRYPADDCCRSIPTLDREWSSDQHGGTEAQVQSSGAAREALKSEHECRKLVDHGLSKPVSDAKCCEEDNEAWHKFVFGDLVFQKPVVNREKRTESMVAAVWDDAFPSSPLLPRFSTPSINSMAVQVPSSPLKTSSQIPLGTSVEPSQQDRELESASCKKARSPSTGPSVRMPADEHDGSPESTRATKGSQLGKSYKFEAKKRGDNGGRPVAERELMPQNGRDTEGVGKVIFTRAVRYEGVGKKRSNDNSTFDQLRIGERVNARQRRKHRRTKRGENGRTAEDAEREAGNQRNRLSNGTDTQDEDEIED